MADLTARHGCGSRCVSAPYRRSGSPTALSRRPGTRTIGHSVRSNPRDCVRPASSDPCDWLAVEVLEPQTITGTWSAPERAVETRGADQCGEPGHLVVVARRDGRHDDQDYDPAHLRRLRDRRGERGAVRWSTSAGDDRTAAAVRRHYPWRPRPTTSTGQRAYATHRWWTDDPRRRSASPRRLGAPTTSRSALDASRSRVRDGSRSPTTSCSTWRVRRSASATQRASRRTASSRARSSCSSVDRSSLVVRCNPRTAAAGHIAVAASASSAYDAEGAGRAEGQSDDPVTTAQVRIVAGAQLPAQRTGER